MMVRRRSLLRVIVASLIAAPASVLPQDQSKVYRLGYASLRAGPEALDEAFVQGMRELGYVVGRNLVIEYRWADNDRERFQTQIEELLRLNVDVIVTSSAAAVRAAMRATKTVPIVIEGAADPVGSGLVASLAHPGGNVTGMSLLFNDLAPKRLQLLRELLPDITRVAVLGWRPTGLAPGSTAPGRDSTAQLILETQAAASRIGVDVSPHIVETTDGLPQAFAQMKRNGVQAVLVQNSPFTFQRRAEIVGAFSRDRLPAMYEVGEFVDAGGLVSYGPDVRDTYRRAAAYVDRIFKGANPADLPMEQPTKFELVINLRTANVLGLRVPQPLLLRADKVIR
jgi:putative ABC transport system substrate-binding protein